MKQIENLQLSLHALSKDIIGNYCMGRFDGAAAYADSMAQLAAVVAAMLNASHDIDKNEGKLIAGGLTREQREAAKKRLRLAGQRMGQAERKLADVMAAVDKASQPIVQMDVERLRQHWTSTPKELHAALKVSDAQLQELEAMGMHGAVINLDDPMANRPQGSGLN